MAIMTDEEVNALIEAQPLNKSAKIGVDKP